jgi:peptidoglycan-N-acetylglucosamine deacetylase
MTPLRLCSTSRRRRTAVACLLIAACSAPVTTESPTDADVEGDDPVADFAGYYTLPGVPRGFSLSQAPATPRPPFVLSHGRRDRKKIALTFDACSSPKHATYNEQVAEILAATATPATIFVGGKWALEAPDHVIFLASLPNIEIANHGWAHQNLVHVPEADVRREVGWAQDVLYTLTGKIPRLFRPPFAEYDASTVKVAAELGLVVGQYDVASGDPDERFTTKVLTRWVTDSVKNGSIILMHINRRGWHTAEALPDIIGELTGRGFEFVTASELLDELPPEPPTPAPSPVCAIETYGNPADDGTCLNKR